MMGWQTGNQRQLFYLFNLERRIPASHLLAEIFMLKLEAEARAAREPPRFVPMTPPSPPLADHVGESSRATALGRR
jgi:hypothetical protein